MGEKFYTPKEIAEILEVTERTVARWIKEDKLSAYKFGGNYKVKKEDFDEFMRQSYKPAKKGSDK